MNFSMIIEKIYRYSDKVVIGARMIHLIENNRNSVWSEVCTVIGRYKLDQISFYIKEFTSNSSSILILGCPTDIQKNINKTFKNVEFLDFSNSDGLKKSLKNKDQYQLILIPFLGIMSVIDHEEQENILKILRDYIIPSGKLVFDVDIPDMQVMLCDPATTFFEHQIHNDQKSGSIIINTQRDYDEYTQTINLNIFVEFLDPSGAVDRKIMNQIFSRYTFRWEMYNLLLLCGYKSIDLYGDYEGNYFSENSHSMIWVSSF